ncbi:hypothetical protein CR513_16681, partial [Mucuna pruriens]
MRCPNNQSYFVKSSTFGKLTSWDHSLSPHLENTLWAHRTTYRTLLGMSPYRINLRCGVLTLLSTSRVGLGRD